MNDMTNLKNLLGLDDDAEIKQLAALSPLDYCRVRKTVAKRLEIRVGELDRLVREARKANSVDDDPEHWVVEPYAGPVDGARLLDEMKAIFERYLVLSTHVAEAIALWVMHTWTIVACDISPYLALISPERRCGKTTALKLLNRLARRTALASNITPAALFRYIEAKFPTLLIDEFDAAIKDNEEMRGILNSGHSREAAFCIRCDGEDNHPKRFSTWAPKAIAAIKKVPDTLMDRSIVVPMRRKKKTEHRARYRDRDHEEFRQLRSQALRWASDHVEGLRDAEPEVTDALNDRAADNWRPLLAIADRVGAQWPKLARSAALALSGDDVTADDTVGVALLADIRTIFAERNVDRLASADLVEALTAIEGRPWAEWRGGKPLNAHGLARLLAPFRIVATTIRVGSRTPKGYQLAHFADSFDCYLSGEGGFEVQHRHNGDETGTSSKFESATSNRALHFEKYEKPASDGHCGDVAVALPDVANGRVDRMSDDFPGLPGRAAELRGASDEAPCAVQDQPPAAQPATI